MAFSYLLLFCKLYIVNTKIGRKIERERERERELKLQNSYYLLVCVLAVGDLENFWCPIDDERVFHDSFSPKILFFFFFKNIEKKTHVQI